MKRSDQLAFMRDEVQRSKRWRAGENYDELWKRMIDLYRGRHYQGKSVSDRLVVNLAFATKNVIAPSVAINNPRFTVNARRPEDAPNAIIAEEVLNYQWRCNKYQDEIRLAVDDWIICGHGWVKTGYKFVKEPVTKSTDESGDGFNSIDNGAEEGVDDREPVPGNTESEMQVTTDRPYLERISIFDMFVNPEARHPKELRWIAQRTWRPVQDVRVDSRYDRSARRQVGASMKDRTNYKDSDGRDNQDRPDAGPLSFCEVIEFYDLRRRTVATFILEDGNTDGAEPSRGLFLIKPQPIPVGFDNPFLMLRNYEVPDNFYPMGELENIETLQLELNETRTQMLNHRKRFARKWLYDESAFSQDGVKALESDIDNTMIPVVGNTDLTKVIAPMPSIVTPPDFYNQSGLIEEDINTISGVSDYMRGQPETNIRRTATEAAMIQDAANSRARDKLAKVESFLSDCGERIIKLMQQFMTGEYVARITGVAGRAWVNYDSDYLQGQFDFEVEGGSTEPRNESFRRQSALQMVDAMAPFVGTGVVDPMNLARHVLQYGFGIKDVSSFLAQAQQPGPVGPDGQPLPPQGPQGPTGAPEAQPADLADPNAPAVGDMETLLQQLSGGMSQVPTAVG